MWWKDKKWQISNLKIQSTINFETSDFRLKLSKNNYIFIFILNLKKASKPHFLFSTVKINPSFDNFTVDRFRRCWLNQKLTFEPMSKSQSKSKVKIENCQIRLNKKRIREVTQDASERQASLVKLAKWRELSLNWEHDASILKLFYSLFLKPLVCFG